MVMSGAVLYIDKIYQYTHFQFDVGWYSNVETFIWHMGQTFSPLLIVAAVLIGFHKITLNAPVVAYGIQTFFVLSDLKDEQLLMPAYILAIIMIIYILYVLTTYVKRPFQSALKIAIDYIVISREKSISSLGKTLFGNVKDVRKDINLIDEKFDEVIIELNETV